MTHIISISDGRYYAGHCNGKLRCSHEAVTNSNDSAPQANGENRRLVAVSGRKRWLGSLGCTEDTLEYD